MKFVTITGDIKYNPLFPLQQLLACHEISNKLVEHGLSQNQNDLHLEPMFDTCIFFSSNVQILAVFQDALHHVGFSLNGISLYIYFFLLINIVISSLQNLGCIPLRFCFRVKGNKKRRNNFIKESEQKKIDRMFFILGKRNIYVTLGRSHWSIFFIFIFEKKENMVWKFPTPPYG